MSTSASDYEFVNLTRSDVEDIYALYGAAQATSPYGHLAVRTLADFNFILSNAETVAAIGARHNGRLVAYSICAEVDRVPYTDCQFLRHIDSSTEPTYSGMGTVVDPRHEGRLIMARLLEMRRGVLRSRSIKHMVGLVDVTNTASIASILRSGAILVGFANDETSLNYIAYGGKLKELVSNSSLAQWTPLDDRFAQQDLFAGRKIALSMKRNEGGSRELGFAPTAT